MVLIHYKKSEKNNFILQFPGNTLISEVLAGIIEINNIRIYLDRLIWSVEELAKKGVLKPPELQAVSFEDFEKDKHQFASLPQSKLQYGSKPKVEAPYRYVPDKHNQRYGVILPEESQKLLLNAVQMGKKVMEPKKYVINKNQIIEAIEQIRLSVMMAYPAYIELPEWEPTFLLLEEKLQLAVLESENFELYDMKSTIWWTGKQLQSTKKLSEYAGKIETTKIIVRVQKLGGEQPPREPPVDNATYQQMVKYYYKKVDESKEMEKKSVEAHYEKIQAASLKEKLHLGEDIKYKPF